MEVKVIWGHQTSKTENLVIAISQERNDRHFSYLIHIFFMLRGRTQLFMAGVKGHLRSSEVKKQNFPSIPCNVIWGHPERLNPFQEPSFFLFWFLAEGRQGIYAMVMSCVCVCVYVYVCVCMCVCVFVTLLVIAISQDTNDRHFSYLVYRFVMVRGRTLLFW